MKEILEIYERYKKFFEEIEKLAGIDLSIEPTIKLMDMKPKRIQHCYRDMKKLKFKGDIWDFLCWVSAQYLIVEWSKKAELIEPLEAFKMVCEQSPQDTRNLIRLFLRKPMLIFNDPLFCGSTKEIYDTINSIRYDLLFQSVKS